MFSFPVIFFVILGETIDFTIEEITSARIADHKNLVITPNDRLIRSIFDLSTSCYLIEFIFVELFSEFEWNCESLAIQIDHSPVVFLVIHSLLDGHIDFPDPPSLAKSNHPSILLTIWSSGVKF